MRSMIFGLVVGLAALGAGASKGAAEETCSIRDSALCLANPNCHWEYQKRGCYPGPGAKEDGCAAHEDQAICDADDSIGCKWAAEKNKCVSAK